MVKFQPAVEGKFHDNQVVAAQKISYWKDVVAEIDKEITGKIHYSYDKIQTYARLLFGDGTPRDSIDLEVSVKGDDYATFTVLLSYDGKKASIDGFSSIDPTHTEMLRAVGELVSLATDIKSLLVYYGFNGGNKEE